MLEQRAEKLLFDVSEVASMCGLSRSHVYTYVQSGRLRSLKAGRRRKVTLESVREFIKELQQEECAAL